MRAGVRIGPFYVSDQVTPAFLGLLGACCAGACVLGSITSLFDGLPDWVLGLGVPVGIALVVVAGLIWYDRREKRRRAGR